VQFVGVDYFREPHGRMGVYVRGVADVGKGCCKRVRCASVWKSKYWLSFVSRV